MWSCAFGTCVGDGCGAGASCHEADAGCMRCDGREVCAVAEAQCSVMSRLVLEQATCQPGVSFESLSVRRRVDCRFDVFFADAGAAGEIWFGPDGAASRTVYASLPAFGGRCIGQVLPTGAERWLVSCPACQLSLLRP